MEQGQRDTQDLGGWGWRARANRDTGGKGERVTEEGKRWMGPGRGGDRGRSEKYFMIGHIKAVERF